MANFKAKLAKAAKAWSNATKKKPDFGTELPDGTYHARIVKAEMGESQSKGRLQVAWQAVILKGEHKNEKANWWNGMETEDNMMYFQRDLVRLGKEVPEDPSEIEDVLKEIEKEKPTVRIAVKTNGEFTNIRIGKKLDSDEVGDEEEPTEDEAPAEEPAVEAEPEPEVEAEPEVEPEPEAEEVVEEVVEEVEEEPTVEVGMRVAFDLKGKEIVGSVTSIDTELQKVVVKSDQGPSFKLAPEKLRPAPKAKVTKKTK